MDENAAPEVKPKTSWLPLIVLAAAQFMLIVDVSIVNIALPAIQRALEGRAPRKVIVVPNRIINVVV